MTLSDIFKHKGCPNCKTEKNTSIFNVDEFKSYKKLNHIMKIGNSTDVFACNECSSKYIQVNNGHLRHLISPKYKAVFEKFSSDEGLTLKSFKKKLNSIEGNDLFEYNLSTPAETIFTCSVYLKDRTKIEQAVIIFKDYLWPVAEDIETLRFVDEIDEVEENRQALTQEQKQAMIDAPEVRMGSAPIWLEKDHKIYMMLQGNYFLPKNFGKACDYNLIKDHGKPEEIIDSGKIHYFIGRL